MARVMKVSGKSTKWKDTAPILGQMVAGMRASLNLGSSMAKEHTTKQTANQKKASGATEKGKKRKKSLKLKIYNCRRSRMRIIIIVCLLSEQEGGKRRF